MQSSFHLHRSTLSGNSHHADLQCHVQHFRSPSKTLLKGCSKQTRVKNTKICWQNMEHFAVNASNLTAIRAIQQACSYRRHWLFPIKEAHLLHQRRNMQWSRMQASKGITFQHQFSSHRRVWQHEGASSHLLICRMCNSKKISEHKMHKKEMLGTSKNFSSNVHALFWHYANDYTQWKQKQIC